MDSPPLLAFRHLRLLFESPFPVALPEFPGSAWRGVLGHGLREAACVTGAPQCAGCMLASACAYLTLFESPTTPGEFGHNTQAPHGFTLHAPRAMPKAATAHALGLTVFGEDEHPSRWLVEGLRRGALRGVGNHRARLTLTRVEQFSDSGWQAIGPDSLTPLPCKILSVPAAPSGALAVSLETPLRLKHVNEFLTVEHFSPSIWLRALARRMADLSRLHDQGRFVYPRGLASNLTATQHTLEWVELERFSNRQRMRHKTGGLMGRFFLAPDAVTAHWPLLWTGQFAHVGKLTALGHGAYRLEPQACEASSSPPGLDMVRRAESLPSREHA